MVGKSSRI